MGAPYSRPCAISARRTRAWTAEQWGDRGGRRIPPNPVSTRFQVRRARGKPRIARVGVALDAGARRVAAPPPSRRRQRGRACAVAAARHCSPDRARTRDALGAGGGSGCPSAGPRPTGRRGGLRVPAAAATRSAWMQTLWRRRPTGGAPLAARMRARAQRRRGHPPAGAKCTGGGGQGRACPNSGQAPRRPGGVATPAAAPPWAARRHANAGGGGGARWQAAAAAVARDLWQSGGGAVTRLWRRPPPA